MEIHYFPADHSQGNAIDITSSANYPALCRPAQGQSGPRLAGLNLARAFYGAASCPGTDSDIELDSDVEYVLLVDDTRALSSYLLTQLRAKGLLQRHRGREIVRPAVVDVLLEGQDSGMNVHVIGEMAYRLSGRSANTWFADLTDSAGNAFCELPQDAQNTLNDFASQTIEMNNELKVRMLQALHQFETTMSFDSAHNATADVGGAMAKEVLKEAKKFILGKIGAQVPGFDIAVSLVNSATAEMARAQQAQRSQSMGQWIIKTREAITDCFGNSSCQSAGSTTTFTSSVAIKEALALQVCSLPENRHVEAVQQIRQALNSSLVSGLPNIKVFEQRLFEGWINANYRASTHQDQPSVGTIDIRWDVEGLGSNMQFDLSDHRCTVNIPEYGDNAEGEMNRIIEGLSNLNSPLDFQVKKKVCFKVDNTMPGGRSWVCWLLDTDNRVLYRGVAVPDNQGAQAFSNDYWREHTRRFKR